MFAIGDRVRTCTGWVGLIGSAEGNLYWVDTGNTDGMHGPYREGMLALLRECEWFAYCTEETVYTRQHPILGELACCERCARVAR